MRILLLLPVLSACAPTQHHQGCISSYRAPDFDCLHDELTAVRSRWSASGIRNYRYAPDISNFGTVAAGGQLLPVTVREGQVQGSKIGWHNWTMEQHFEEIDRDLSTARKIDSCLVVGADYDGTDGHILGYSSGDLKEGLMYAAGGVTLRNFTRN